MIMRRDEFVKKAHQSLPALGRISRAVENKAGSARVPGSFSDAAASIAPFCGGSGERTPVGPLISCTPCTARSQQGAIRSLWVVALRVPIPRTLGVLLNFW